MARTPPPPYLDDEEETEISKKVRRNPMLSPPSLSVEPESREADAARMYAIAPPAPSLTTTMTAPPAMTPPAPLMQSVRDNARLQAFDPTLTGATEQGRLDAKYADPGAIRKYDSAGPRQDTLDILGRMDALDTGNVSGYQARQMGLTPPAPTTNQPVDPRFAGTGVGERASGTGVIIGRSQGFSGPPAPLPSAEQTAAIKRMNANWSPNSDSAMMKSAAAALFSRAKMERNPALAAQIYREAADMLGKSAAARTTPQTGYAAAEQQNYGRDVAAEERANALTIGVSKSQAPLVKEQIRNEGRAAIEDKKTERATRITEMRRDTAEAMQGLKAADAALARKESFDYAKQLRQVAPAMDPVLRRNFESLILDRSARAKLSQHRAAFDQKNKVEVTKAVLALKALGSDPDPDDAEKILKAYEEATENIALDVVDEVPAPAAPTAQPPAATAAQPGGETAPAPMPASKAQLVKDRKYITAKGVATWDGTQFVQ